MCVDSEVVIILIFEIMIVIIEKIYITPLVRNNVLSAAFILVIAINYFFASFSGTIINCESFLYSFAVFIAYFSSY